MPTEFYRAASYRPDNSVGYLMRRILTIVGQEIERQLESSDLTNAQWLPLLKRCVHPSDVLRQRIERRTSIRGRITEQT